MSVQCLFFPKYNFSGGDAHRRNPPRFRPGPPADQATQITWLSSPTQRTAPLSLCPHPSLGPRNPNRPRAAGHRERHRQGSPPSRLQKKTIDRWKQHLEFKGRDRHKSPARRVYAVSKGVPGCSVCCAVWPLCSPLMPPRPLFQTSVRKTQPGLDRRSRSRNARFGGVHNNNTSLRVEAARTATDAVVRFAPVALTIGKRYELSGWVRTDDLAVRDLDRSPIAIGAALTMASMPFDVHSASRRRHAAVDASLACASPPPARRTHPAHRRQRRSFERQGLVCGRQPRRSIDQRTNGPRAPRSQTFGPAYRYPTGGWIYLHIEGQPYERGYQHGHLMAKKFPNTWSAAPPNSDPRQDGAGTRPAPPPTRCSCAASTRRSWRR